MEGGVRESVGQHGAGVLVDLAGEDGGDAGGLHAEVGPADAGEQGDVVEIRHGFPLTAVYTGRMIDP